MDKKGKQVVKVTKMINLAWLRETLEWQQEMQDPQQFLEYIKNRII